MNTPLSWIKDYVPGLSCTPQEYSDRMTLSGTKVESYEELSKNLEKIVVGKVLSVEKHPMPTSSPYARWMWETIRYR